MKLDLVLDEVQLPWRPTPEWTARVESLSSPVASSTAVLQLVLTDDRTLREHNREYRGLDETTDVLSFSYLGPGHEDRADELRQGTVPIEDFLDEPHDAHDAPLAGQVLVSVETVVARGPRHTGDLDAEMAFMLVHGMLHVLGHDHHDEAGRERMQRAERELMRTAGFALAESWPAEESGGAWS